MPTNVDDYRQHRHHHPGGGHPPATVSPSILRLSAAERLSAAGAVIALIWGIVLWAIAGSAE